MSYGVLWQPGFNLSSTFHSHLPPLLLSLSLSVSLSLPPSANKAVSPQAWQWGVIYLNKLRGSAVHRQYRGPTPQKPVRTITWYLIDQLYCSFVRPLDKYYVAQCDDWLELWGDIFIGSSSSSIIFSFHCDFSAESAYRFNVCVSGIYLTFSSTAAVLLHGVQKPNNLKSALGISTCWLVHTRKKERIYSRALSFLLQLP